jgi:hypothetical protein
MKHTEKLETVKSAYTVSPIVLAALGLGAAAPTVGGAIYGGLNEDYAPGRGALSRAATGALEAEGIQSGAGIGAAIGAVPGGLWGLKNVKELADIAAGDEGATPSPKELRAMSKTWGRLSPADMETMFSADPPKLKVLSLLTKLYNLRNPLILAALGGAAGMGAGGYGGYKLTKGMTGRESADDLGPFRTALRKMMA